MHPFHPLAGREFELLVRRHTWEQDRVFFLDEEGQMRSLPTGWTDAMGEDPFVVVAAGRSAFRVEDLLALAALVDSHGRAPRDRVRRTTPHV